MQPCLCVLLCAWDSSVTHTTTHTTTHTAAWGGVLQDHIHFLGKKGSDLAHLSEEKQLT